MSSEIINLNNSTPAAPSGAINVAWQKGSSSGNDPATGVPIYPVTASVPIARGSELGVVQPDGTTIDVNGSGVISVPTATTSQLGLVKPDGTTITISGGVISASGGGGGGTGWGGGEAAFTTPVLSNFTQDNFGTTGTSTVAETFSASGVSAIRLRERGAGGNTNHLRNLLVSIPTTTSKWAVTARLRCQTTVGTWHDLGLVLKDSVSGKCIQYGWGADTGAPFVYVTWASTNSIPASASADTLTTVSRMPYDIWLQIYYDGTNLNFNYSRDGQYFITCKQTTATSYLTNPANQCGIGINPNNSYNVLVETVLECFSFSVVNV